MKITINVFGLTLVFIILKLTNLITWNWALVLSPLWIAFGLWIFFIIIILIVALFIAMFN